MNLTHLEVYSIDPEDCIDVDDAFSIDGNFLYIHIADPTRYISNSDHVFRQISQKIITKYYTTHTDHLFPDEILKKSSLHSDSVEEKYAITFIYENLILQQITESIIKVKKENKLTYETTKSFEKGIKWAKELRTKRNAKTYDNIKIITKYPYISTYNDLHMMIEEFAILCNRSINVGIYKNNKNYSMQNYAHQNLNLNIYSHFTSPLRRFTDCIAHFLFRDHKAFTKNEINYYIEISNKVIREDRIRQNREFYHKILEIFEKLKDEIILHVDGKIIKKISINDLSIKCFIKFSDEFRSFKIKKLLPY